MAQNDLLRRYLDAGIAFTQMTRERAEELVRELVRAGEVQREQTQQWVEELVERGRRNREQLTEVVRRELRSQLEATPLATRIDLDRLERRLAEVATAVNRLSEGPRRAAEAVRDRAQGRVPGVAKAAKTATKAVKAGSSPTKTGAKPAPVKQASVKKAGAKKAAGGTATAAKKTAAKKTAAKKTAAKKTARPA